MITALLALALFMIALFGIQRGKRSMLRVMEKEGIALLEGLVVASQNTIKASTLVEDLVEQKLEAISQSVEREMEEGKADAPFLKRSVKENELLGIAILDDEGKAIRTSGIEKKDIYPSGDSIALLALKSVIDGKLDKAFVEIQQEDSTLEYLFAIKKNKNYVVILTSASYIEKFRKDIGVGYLIQRIGQKRGIEYIVLQSREGIVLASKNVKKMLRIEEDQFLKDALFKNQALSRTIDFEGNKVLEVVQPFAASEIPSGIFRVGLSLNEYRRISQSYQTHMIIFTSVLFLLALLFIGAVIVNQNYSLLDRSYREMKTLTGNILEAINSAVVAVDKDKQIIMFNRAAEEIFSVNRDRVISQSYSGIFPQDDCLLNETIDRGRKVHQMEKKYKTFSGDERYLVIGTSSFLDEKGESRGAVAVVHDITGLKEFEEKAKRAERLSELGNLAAGVAHEIRNPLNAISIAAQRLSREFSPQGNQEEYLFFTQTMLDEIKRLNQIINQFLSLAKAQKLNLVRTDLESLLKDILQLLRIEAEQKGIAVRENIALQLPAVALDREEMKKAILNIALNAIQATSAKGTVSVSARDDKANRELAIEIADTGEGIAGENLPKLFQPYFSTKEKGTGLGLSIAYRIIADHKGSIVVQSKLGQGTAFTIKLPYKV